MAVKESASARLPFRLPDLIATVFNADGKMASHGPRINMNTPAVAHVFSPHPTGSSWRRWDPHLHAPGTAKEDQFKGDWDGYLTKIESAEPNIAALGITDYFTTRLFREVLERQKGGRLRGMFLFPNVELRVLPGAQGSGINIHLLVDPAHLDDFEMHLADLGNTIGQKFVGCSEEALAKYGRSISMDKTLPHEAAFKLGVEKFHLEFTALADWLKKDFVKEHVIVAVPNGKDGLAGLPADGTHSERRAETARLSRIVFGASPADRAYWLGQKKGHDPKVFEKEGGVKPCIHGSDAHCLDAVANPQGGRLTWIKADPTFEGLRQIMCEPEERVFIGATPPAALDHDRVIESIEFVDGKGWFVPGQIQLSPFLTCIIGAKGSGKTALADTIALAADAWRAPKESFLSKAREHVTGLSLNIRWAGGRENTAFLDDDSEHTEASEKIQYLSQQFVEELCSEDRQAQRLQEEIERVVFERLDQNEVQGYETFQDMLKESLAPVELTAASLREQIADLNQQIYDSLKRQEEKTPKEQLLKESKDRVVTLKRQMPTYKEAEHQKLLEQYQLEDARLQEQTTIESGARQSLRSIDQLRLKLRSFASRIETEFEGLKKDARAIGLAENLTGLSINPAVHTIIALIDETKKVQDEKLRSLIGHAPKDDSWTTVDVDSGGFSIEERKSFLKFLSDKLSLDQNKLDQIKTLQAGTAAETKKQLTLARDLDGIRQVEAARPEWSNNRLEAYIAYFETLKEHERLLARFYSPLRKYIEIQKETGDKLELQVRRIVDVERWVSEGQRMLDLRTSHPFAKEGAIAAFTQKHLVQAWITGDAEGLRQGIEELTKTLFKGASDVLRKPFTRRDLANWIFGLGHIRVEYGIQYNNTPLEYLSPGSRGIVLLRLYLDLDVSDNRPLLIDQPEENLDNRSVYAFLTRYFRRAKARRQVIMVTHNPNLVVNTDAELVIIAESSHSADDNHPFFHYTCGAIESVVAEERAIKQEICDILEGGIAAFHRRETRYSVPRRRLD